jgi:PIN domain nuclease of toxin-antitoxin system
VWLLADTCALLWIMTEPERVPGPVAELFEDRRNRLFVSVVSFWEITIKVGIGRLELPMNPRHFTEHLLACFSVDVLPVSLAHALQAGDLPLHHRDPFDRMLIVQGQVEGIPIVTADSAFTAYDIKTFW